MIGSFTLRDGISPQTEHDAEFLNNVSAILQDCNVIVLLGWSCQLPRQDVCLAQSL